MQEVTQTFSRALEELNSAAATLKAASKEAIESLPRILDKSNKAVWGNLVALVREFNAQIHSDPLIGNMLRIADSRASERSRLRAARALAKLTEAGIASQRWPFVKSDLKMMARQHGRPTKKERALLITSAIFNALDAAGDLSITDKEAISEAIQRRVNDLLTQDILGPEWRRKSKSEPLTGEEEGPDLSTLREVETRLDVSGLIHKAHLSDREAELMGLLRKDEDISEAARTMGIEDSTARNLKSTALKKIRELKKS
jgi:hypothetical protein